MPCIYTNTNGPKKDLPCNRLAIPIIDLCRRCIPKKNALRRYLSNLVEGTCRYCDSGNVLEGVDYCVECLLLNYKTMDLEKLPSTKQPKIKQTPLKQCCNVIKVGKNRGNQCTNRTRSDLCCKCKKFKSAGELWSPCPHVFTKGLRKDEFCGILTGHESGLCSKCRKIKSYGTSRQECRWILTRGPRKGLTCDNTTKHKSGFCYKCRKNEKTRKLLEDESLSHLNDLPALVYKDDNGQIKSLKGDDLIDLFSTIPDFLNKIPNSIQDVDVNNSS